MARRGEDGQASVEMRGWGGEGGEELSPLHAFNVAGVERVKRGRASGGWLARQVRGRGWWATAASTATGGGPTWATGSGYQHPNDSSLSGAVWVGTGTWTSTATPTLTSNSGYTWYIAGLTTGA